MFISRLVKGSKSRCIAAQRTFSQDINESSRHLPTLVFLRAPDSDGQGYRSEEPLENVTAIVLAAAL